ncbi:MAG: hypothetical protein SFX72_16015 [Isosphaeraceae bacterium]|nr:hypothetical protein [Isosphaeraceae bacterium]
MKAGTWDKDLLIAEREVRVAAAELELAKAERKRYRIQAPCEAVVVKVDVRRGEHFDVANHEHPLVTLAPIGRMQVRVQVDEEDAGRVALSSQAEGFLRGPVRERLELRSLRLEPRVVPKSSTVGSSTERIDTRVMFLIYEVVSAPPRIYPGQRIDVFIQAAGPEHD